MLHKIARGIFSLSWSKKELLKKTQHLFWKSWDSSLSDSSIFLISNESDSWGFHTFMVVFQYFFLVHVVPGPETTTDKKCFRSTKPKPLQALCSVILQNTCSFYLIARGISFVGSIVGFPFSLFQLLAKIIFGIWNWVERKRKISNPIAITKNFSLGNYVSTRRNQNAIQKSVRSFFALLDRCSKKVNIICCLNVLFCTLWPSFSASSYYSNKAVTVITLAVGTY